VVDIAQGVPKRPLQIKNKSSKKSKQYMLADAQITKRVRPQIMIAKK
jgi:hypothetical protein